MAKQLKKSIHLSEQDLERLEMLQAARKKQGKQLRINIEKGTVEEIDEMRSLLKKKTENPEEKYKMYYLGMTNLLRKYLPKGPEFKEGRQLIYDEKNVFLNLGKKKSDNNGIRKSDGRMTYQAKMGEMLDVITKWVSSSQNPTDLFTDLYELNEKYGYGHENYDKVKQESKYQKKLPKKG
jgi:hypothetical protein